MRALTKDEQAEISRFQNLAAKSRADGCRLDAWAYESCAKDIVERAAGIRRCGSCGRIIGKRKKDWPS